MVNGKNNPQQDPVVVVIRSLLSNGKVYFNSGFIVVCVVDEMKNQ